MSGEPTSTIVRMPAAAGSRSARVVTVIVSSGPVASVTSVTGVPGSSTSASTAAARARWSGRPADRGLNSARASPAPAAARSWASIRSHGTSRSDSVSAAWGPASGAPAAAAAAWADVTPGTTSTATPRDAAASNVTDAMANTPGSPDDTSATRQPAEASATASPARSASAPMAERRTSWPGRSSGPAAST